VALAVDIQLVICLFLPQLLAVPVVLLLLAVLVVEVLQGIAFRILQADPFWSFH
jgi:hypothetical protein